MLAPFSKFSTFYAHNISAKFSKITGLPAFLSSSLSSLLSSLVLPVQRPLRNWFFLFMLLNIADLISTFILFHARLVNGNPLDTFLLHHIGLLPILIGKVILIIVATLATGKVASRSPESLDTALNLLIIFIGVVLLSVTLTMTQFALA